MILCCAKIFGPYFVFTRKNLNVIFLGKVSNLLPHCAHTALLRHDYAIRLNINYLIYGR